MPHNKQQRSSIIAVMNDLKRPVTTMELLKHASIKSPGLGLMSLN